MKLENKKKVYLEISSCKTIKKTLKSIVILMLQNFLVFFMFCNTFSCNCIYNLLRNIKKLCHAVYRDIK